MAEQEKLQVIIVHSAKYQTTYTKKYENRKVWEEPNLNHIKSYIPGTVIDILIKEGQKVEAGDSIMILDAMKMYNDIKMPFKGTIQKINIEKGQKIPKNYVMIEIEPAE
ncbi:MAG TPA: acetyl-CoA carboxylase biotin carboxyl carrier protein subunit [Prolixibacteraceae bacterium]|jgi:pyruvate carboxylase|nr:acetyl-CoA carboxylase biotin carboxyl carrier protein subunit [Prolixibacteraceae bacterium]